MDFSPDSSVGKRRATVRERERVTEGKVGCVNLVCVCLCVQECLILAKITKIM